MKNLLVLLMFTIVACGRNNNSGGNDCRSRESMKIECQVVQTPQYGRVYAQELCNRTYSANKCY